MQDEHVLLARARQLDQEALATIHDQYYEPIFRYISFRVNDIQTAEDLTSEVFIRLLKAIRNRSAPAKTLQGWLYTVAQRLVIDHYRKEKRVQHVELHESLSGTNTPDQVVEMRLTREDLQQAMEHLTEDQHNVIALRFGQELPIREVANIIGKSEGAIKQLQVRALASLARHLKTETN